MKLYTSLEENVQEIERRFADCGDLVSRTFPVGERQENQMHITYIDMMVDRDLIETKIMRSLMQSIRQTPLSALYIKSDVFAALKNGGILTAEVEEKDDFDQITLAMLSGDTVLFLDGHAKAFVVSTKGWPNRGVPQAESEVVVQGSKEAFNEVFRVSSALIRRRIRDTRLKLKQMKVGRRSQTDVGLMYLEDVARPAILEEIENKIQNIDADAILDSGAIAQYIEDDWLSPFPQVEVTERPDKAAAAILDGRIVILVDTSPFVLIAPTTLNAMVQSSEDFYQRWHIMSATRFLRYVAGFLALALPALYIAVAVYHPSMLPTLLAYKMAGARQMVPFPAVVEVILMDFSFELLREAGIRLPGPIGGAIGIVGGLIIGQAAVEAGLVSPIVVIIVALTGICGFAVPSVQLVSGCRLMKYILIFSAAFLGLFGFWIGLLFILVHLVSLKSFGIPYMFPYASGEVNQFSDFKDTLIRLPLFMMKNRPIFANQNAKRRLDPPETGNRHDKE